MIHIYNFIYYHLCSKNFNQPKLNLDIIDVFKLDYNKIGTNKLFYDLIYNPSKTNFLTKGKELGNQITNGKMMFIYQAQLASVSANDFALASSLSFLFLARLRAFSRS